MTILCLRSRRISKQPRRDEERAGAQDDVGPEPGRGGQDRVDGEADGLLPVEVAPHAGAAAFLQFAGLGQGPVEEPQRRIERVFLDLLPEAGEGLGPPVEHIGDGPGRAGVDEQPAQAVSWRIVKGMDAAERRRAEREERAMLYRRWEAGDRRLKRRIVIDAAILVVAVAALVTGLLMGLG